MTKILVDKLVLEQALGAMRCAVPTGKITLTDWYKSITALRAALEEPVQEPVAQVHPNHLKPTDDGKPWCREVLLYSGDHNGDLFKGENYRVKLYTAPT